MIQNHKNIAITLLLISILLSFTPVAISEPIPIVTIDELSIPSGQTKTTMLLVTNVTHLGSYEIKISWNPSVIELTSVTDTDFTISSYIDDDGGYATLVGYHMDEANGNADLAQLSFTAVSQTTNNCDVNFITSDLLTADPQPDAIAHQTRSAQMQITADQPSDDDHDDGDDDGGGGGGFLPPTNQAPQADLSAGAPYTGNVNEPILFDGSKSTDTDGTIIRWFWTFGDGTDSTGETTSHSYQKPGDYVVTLTVTDDQEETNTVETTVTISQPNTPPGTPHITGPKQGSTNISYQFILNCTDADHDLINYTINWGDHTTETTSLTNHQHNFTVNHTWKNNGIYQISVSATDEHNQSSAITTSIIFIDVTVHYITDTITGYLIDTDMDTIYDRYHHNQTNIETAVEQHHDGGYLIDSNQDGSWDYVYDETTMSLEVYDPQNSYQEPEQNTPGLSLVFLFMVIMISILYYKKRPFK